MLAFRKAGGNCYHVSEAAFHILGGKSSGWQPMRTKLDVPKNYKGYAWHWFLKHESGMILDLSRKQFEGAMYQPDYSKAIRSGFLTRHPANLTKLLMVHMTYQPEIEAEIDELTKQF